jgi:hypothetical protein
VDWLNYHHLLYFWTVAKEGSVSKAAESLHLAQPTVSAQLRALERSLGHKLLQKQGRGLVLTAEGEAVFRYAEEIFSLGQRYRVRRLGELEHVRERFYAISVERKLTHPAVLLIAEQARRRLFGGADSPG